MATPTLEITQSGRSGSIYYREGKNTITFDWEFQLSPVLALISGPESKTFDEKFPWAAGRQAEIFDFVGEEVLRQKADGCEFEVELAIGEITILQSGILPRSATPKAKKRATVKPPKHTRAYKKFLASVVPLGEQWGDDQMYDLDAIQKMTARERNEALELLTAQNTTWREVRALEEIPTPEAQAALEAASQHHLLIDTRLAAAEALQRRGRMPDFALFLARQIRRLDRPANGLQRALSLAERNPSDTIKQALLWASYNATECAPHCAKLLLKLAGAAREPFGADIEQMLSKLGLHSSHYDRKAAFDQLSRLVGMELNQENID